MEDLTKQKFGRLKPLRYCGGSKWLCRCDCGTVKHVKSYNLRLGTKSCGCLRAETTSKRNLSTIKHGHARQNAATRTYRSYLGMLSRCYREEDDHYPNYGGRGISVCQYWRESFHNFIKDVGERPKGMTLDRIDVNGNYEPTNCRWANPTTQARNRRSTKLITFDGKTLSQAEWAEVTGVRCLKERLRQGWSLERALTTPVKTRHKRMV